MIATESPAIETVTPEVVGPEEKQALLVVQQNGLLPEAAQSLQNSFAPLFASARSVLEKSRVIAVTDASQKLEIKLARECRLALREIRLNGDKTKKALKEDSLRRGRAIDGFYNILLHLTEQEETRLEEQEKFIERQEAGRKAELQTRRETELKAWGMDTAHFVLGEMSEESYAQLLQSAQMAHAAKQEAVQKAEAERIRIENERLKEEARIREENERLKREAEEAAAAARIEIERREKLAEEERRKAEEAAAEIRRVAAENARIAAEAARKEREAIEEKARQERAAADAKLAEERRKAEEAAAAERKRVLAEREAAEKKAAEERAVFERKMAVEREAREKVEREAELARKAEAERQAAIEAERKRAAAAPDREKLIAFAAVLRGLPIPELASPEAQPVAAELFQQREKFAVWIEKKAAAL